MVVSLLESVDWSPRLGIFSVTISIGYLTLVRLLRWRRYNEIHKKYAAKIDTLTPEEAQDVLFVSYIYDMPGLLNYALSFALFKTYAIPSVSSLLAKTKELMSDETISRRYADTEILVSTFLVCPISGRPARDEKSEKGASDPPAEMKGLDPRAGLAIARVNWLHSKYNISNDDFLYTLSLFILEPMSWCERYGWRALSPLERQAHFVFWAFVGKHMGIKDIPENIEELRKWSKAYEVEKMVPATTNHDVAAYTTEEMLHGIPEAFGLKSLCRNMTICLLEDRVRISMMQPEQSWYLRTFVKAIAYSTTFGHRYLSLPRWKESSVIPLALPKATDGSLMRMHTTRWQAKPWYKPQSSGIGVLFDRLYVWLGFYEDMPGPKYKSEGYRLEEVGPIRFENAGHEAVMRMAADIHGCPIGGPLSLNGGR